MDQGSSLRAGRVNVMPKFAFWQDGCWAKRRTSLQLSKGFSGKLLTQHENNAITLLYTNCLWLKHHDDPISILHFEYCLHIPSILFCIQILVIFWDTVFRQFSHESIQKNDPKFAHRIKYFELPNSLQIRDPEWDHHDVSTINN